MPTVIVQTGDNDADDEPYNPLDPKSVQRRRERLAGLGAGKPTKGPPETDYQKKGFAKPFTSKEQEDQQKARTEALRKFGEREKY